MTLREKLMHYTHDLDCGADLKQEAIATIEHIAQYMDEDELLHHSRPLAIAYLALTEDDFVPVVRCKDCKHFNHKRMECENEAVSTDHEGGAQYSLNFWLDDFCSYGERKDGGADNG